MQLTLSNTSELHLESEDDDEKDMLLSDIHSDSTVINQKRKKKQSKKSVQFQSQTPKIQSSSKKDKSFRKSSLTPPPLGGQRSRSYEEPAALIQAQAARPTASSSYSCSPHSKSRTQALNLRPRSRSYKPSRNAHPVHMSESFVNRRYRSQSVHIANSTNQSDYKVPRKLGPRDIGRNKYPEGTIYDYD